MSRCIKFLILAVTLFGLGADRLFGGVTVLATDGSDSYVQVGTPTALQIPSNNPLTIEAWVYLNSLSARDNFYSKNSGRGSPYTYMFGFIDSGKIAAYPGVGSWQEPSPSVTVSAGQWYHVAFSFDGTTLTYYIDGVAVGTSGFSFSNNTGHTIKLGGYYSSADIDGQLSDVRVWDHARSEAQIQTFMSRRLVGNESGLLGYWRLDEGEGGTAYDLTANGSDGSLVGATWSSSDLDLSLFSVAQPQTGSTSFSNTNAVDVVFFPEFEGYTHFQITEDGAAPDGSPGAWTSTNTPPETIVFTTPTTDTNVVITAWYTNLNASVELKSTVAEIIYTEAVPTAAALANLSRPIAVGYTTVDLAGADLDDGSSGGTAMGQPIGIFNYLLSCAQDVTPENPYLVTLDAIGTYDVELRVVNEAGTISANAITTEVSVVEGATLAWTGLGGDALASTAANWSPAEAPYTGSSVQFDDDHYGNAQTNVTWDLDVVLVNWIQTTNYNGTVTIQTRYPGQGAFTNLVVAGDVTIAGGVWTHPANTGDSFETDRLSVRVDGDFLLGANGMIDLFGRGYAGSRGPGAGVSGQRTGKGASHGGMGAIHGTQLPSSTYGSVTRPESLGSGSTARGGGALLLKITGSATIDGEISTKGANHPTSNRYGGGAGGSLYLEASTVGGSGLLNARGGEGYYTGGGGRIAVIARNGADTGSLSFEAFGGTPATSGRGSPGTIYLQTTAIEKLLIDAGDLVTQAAVATELPPLLELDNYEIHPILGGELEDATLVITNGAPLLLTSSLRLGDFAWISSTSKLDLDGRFLYLKATEPAGAFPGDYGNGSITYDGGDIVWGDATAQMPLYLYSGPNGTASRDPESIDDLYDFGTVVTLSATPDSGYDLIWWEGDVPTGSDRTANPLQVTMDQRRSLRALFGSSDTGTRTWTGDATDRWASSAANWYPAVAPVSGNHVVFDATSVMECFWDLDITLASWTQTVGYEASYDFFEGYFGWVTLHTRYPGQGSFTNLTITGDVVLENGTWTHPANTGGDVQADRMWVTVGGNLTIGTNALIDVSGRGYAATRGPGAGITAQRLTVGYAASHGGRGTTGPDAITISPCYGSIQLPEALGSGGGNINHGGGAVRLEVAGQCRVDGLIDARGKTGTTQHPGPSGGSIYLKAASLSGDGGLNASGTAGFQSGGGGRIAVVLTDSDSTENVALLAHGGNAAFLRSDRGAAGTIFLKLNNTADALLVDNNNYVTTSTNWYTELPPTLDADPEALKEITLELRNQARVGILATDLRIRDLVWVDAGSRLHLLGENLYVRNAYHTFSDGDEDAVVVADGGALIWARPGTLLLVR